MAWTREKAKRLKFIVAGCAREAGLLLLVFGVIEPMFSKEHEQGDRWIAGRAIVTLGMLWLGFFLEFEGDDGP